jgi:predicted DNA-binding transcriptional regulator AlpA
MNSPHKILRRHEVETRTKLSRVTLWRRSRDPDDDFPPPVRLGSIGSNAIGWHEAEIENWIASRPRVSWAPDKTSKPVTPDTTDGGETEL